MGGGLWWQPVGSAQGALCATVRAGSPGPWDQVKGAGGQCCVKSTALLQSFGGDGRVDQCATIFMAPGETGFCFRSPTAVPCH